MKLTITNITCNNPCSGIQDDDLFLLIQADGGVPMRYPVAGSVSMGANDEMPLPDGGYVIDYSYGVIITAWDRDSFLFKSLDSPDYLFNISIGAGSTVGDHPPFTKYNHNGAEYTFTTSISQ